MADNAYTWQFKAAGGQEANNLFSIIDKLDKILQRLTQRESSVSGTFRAMGSASRAAADSSRTLSSAVAEVNKEVIKTSNGVTTISTEYDKLGNVIKRTVDDVNTLNGATTKSRSVFDGQGNVVKQTSSSFSDYSTAVQKSTNTTKSDTSATDTATKRKQSLFAALTHGAGIWNTWNKAVDFAAKRIKQVYSGFTALFSKVQEVGGSFERTRAAIEVLGKSTEKEGGETQRLIDRTKELGRTTEFTAQQAAEGAVTLLKAGETSSTAWDKLGTALQAAQATGLDIAKTAAIGNHAFKIFGDNLGMVGDRTADYDTAMRVMIASANAADVTVSQLDTSLTRGGDILARLGVPLTTVNAALGLMANKGIAGRRAMTHLSAGVKRLVDGTIPAEAALKKLGVTTVDEAGNMRGLASIMQSLNTALDLKPMNERAKLMKDLFGAADKSMGALLNAGVSGFDKLETAIQRNLDVMDELEKARGETMVGSWKQFKSAVESVYIELTGVLSVPIQEFWQSLASILRTISTRIKMVAQDLGEGKGSFEDWIKAIKNGSFSGLFDGLKDELAPQIEVLKTLFKALADAVVNLLKSGLADAAVDIWNAFFTDEVKAKALELGTEMGKAVLKGILSTDIGIVVGSVFAANMLSSALSVATKVKGIITAMGVSSAIPGAAGVIAMPTAATAGVAAGVGVAAGAAVYGGIKVAEHVYNKKAQQADEEAIQTTMDHFKKMLSLKEEIAQKPLTERTEEDSARLERINVQIQQAGDELQKLGAMDIEGDAFAQYYAGQVEKAKAELKSLDEAQKSTVKGIPTGSETQKDIPEDFDPEKYVSKRDQELKQYAEAQRAKMKRGIDAENARLDEISRIWKEQGGSAVEAEKTYNVQQAIKKAEAGQGKEEESTIAGLSEKELETKSQLLSKQEELVNAERKQKEALEASNAVLAKTQIEINNSGAAFDKWLLAPINIFQQKIMGIKESFGGLMDSLKGKKVDVEEKFGLKTPEQASKQRTKNLQESIKRDERLMKLAQTPEEQMKIQERLGGKAAQLAELATGPEQEKFASQAAKYYDEAQKSAADAEELQIKQTEIEQENARKNLSEYEKLVEGAQTAGSRAGYLEQLKEAYMTLGPEYQDKAIQAQEDLKRSRTEAAAEESETQKRIMDANEIQVELLQRAVDALESASTATKEQMSTPPSAEYADV